MRPSRTPAREGPDDAVEGAAVTAPLVRVVVPAHDAERWVGATLASVRAQTLPDWECVVVDDGSTDSTSAVVAAHAAEEPRIRLVRQANEGISSARNRGLAGTPGPVRFVAFLDSDDVWSPSALEVLVAALDARPDAVGAYGYAEYVDEDGRPVRAGEHPAKQRDRRRVSGRRLRAVAPEEDVAFDELVVVGAVWPAAVALHRREAVDAVGGFDEAVSSAEDWDLTLRMSRRGVYVPVGVQVAWYRQHPGQATRDHAVMEVEQVAVRHRTWASPENTPGQRRTAARAWRQVHLRRTARSVLALARALRERRWRSAGRLAVGAGLLAVQNLAPGPPRPRRRVVAFTHAEP